MNDESGQSDEFTCVLMPGLHGTGGLFDDFVAAAPARYRPLVAAYPTDEPLSYEHLAPVVARTLPAGMRYVVVAESFGGPLALRIAAEAPPGLVGLVLCNTFVRPPVWTGWRYAPLGLLLRLPIPAMVLRRYLTGPSPSRDMVDKVRAAIRQPAPSVLAGRIRAVLNVDASQWLADCPVPVLYLHSRSDRLIPDRCLEEMLAIRPQMKTQTLDGPHLLLQTSPRECWSALESFAATS